MARYLCKRSVSFSGGRVHIKINRLSIFSSGFDLATSRQNLHATYRTGIYQISPFLDRVNQKLEPHQLAPHRSSLPGGMRRKLEFRSSLGRPVPARVLFGGSPAPHPPFSQYWPEITLSLLPPSCPTLQLMYSSPL